MTMHHRRIPLLPKRPVTLTFASEIIRSYPTGRKNYTRACKGKVMTLTIGTDEILPNNVKANILTTMNSRSGKEWEKVPFVRLDECTLICKLKPKFAGLHSFRAEFSIDNGKTWVRDNVSDAWVLVDPRQVDGLRLYTLIPAISGTIKDWKADLERIKNMGFNAIHLLPITKQDTSQSPYSAKDLFEIEPSYLEKDSSKNGWEQLEDFIEEAKRLNIHLCFDLVLNHVGVNSSISQQAPDWIVPDTKQNNGLKRAGYWCDEGWLYWDDLILLNYEHPSRAIRDEIWSYMIEYALFWARYANYTEGFLRFDNLHSSNPDFLEQLTSKLFSRYPNLGIIAEYFTDKSTLLHTIPKWRLHLNLATPWDNKFVPQLREYLKYMHRISTHVRYFMPISSHDSGTPAQEFGCSESTVPRYVAAALLGTGATGIVQGVEYGELQKIEFIGRWPKRIFPVEPKFGPFISKVNAILSGYPAFRRGGNCIFIDNGHDAIIAAYRSGTGKNIFGFLVVCNFDTFSTQAISIDLSNHIHTQHPILYCELLSEEQGEYKSHTIEIALSPGGVQVLMLTPKKRGQ